MSIGGAGNCSESEPYALRVLGDSMLPEFKEGVIIIIDPAGAIKDRCYVIATHNDELIFRQLRMQGDKYYLQPLNDLYDTVQINSLDDVAGVITQQAGRRRKDRVHYDR